MKFAELVHSLARFPALPPPRGPASTLRGSGSQKGPPVTVHLWARGPELASSLPRISFADEILHFCHHPRACFTSRPRPALGPGPGLTMMTAQRGCLLASPLRPPTCCCPLLAPSPLLAELSPSPPAVLSHQSSEAQPSPTQPLKPLRPPQAKMISPT